MRLGDDAPKSFSAFRRMKKADSKNWQELEKKYREAGNIEIQKVNDTETVEVEVDSFAENNIQKLQPLKLFWKNNNANELKNSQSRVKINNKKIHFKPAKTLQKAEDYLVSLGFNTTYVRDQINLDVANTINHTVAEYKKVFGEKMKLKSIEECQRDIEVKGFVALCSPSGNIQLSKRYTKASMKIIAEEAMSEFNHGVWSTGFSEQFIRHELGHAVYNGVGKTVHKDKLDTIYKNAIQNLEWGKYGFTPDDYYKHGKTYKKFSDDVKQAGELLSAYGFFPVDEMVAESIAEYMSGNPRQFAFKVVTTLMGW